jgi:hypothetical protein
MTVALPSNTGRERGGMLSVGQIGMVSLFLAFGAALGPSAPGKALAQDTSKAPLWDISATPFRVSFGKDLSTGPEVFRRNEQEHPTV